MEPPNDHERAIAQAVGEKFLEDPVNRHHSIVRDCRNVPGFPNVPLGQSILSPPCPVAVRSSDRSVTFKVGQKCRKN
jgi:hypothetical protein